MSDLRKAAEMALEALELGDDISAEQMSDALEALRQALAQPEQEPVVWVVQYKDRHEFVWGSKPEFRGGTVLAFQPLYMEPPRREWVGLTDEEIESCNRTTTDWGEPCVWLWDDDFEEGGLQFARAIEAKLKERNT